MGIAYEHNCPHCGNNRIEKVFPSPISRKKKCDKCHKVYSFFDECKFDYNLQNCTCAEALAVRTNGMFKWNECTICGRFDKQNAPCHLGGVKHLNKANKCIYCGKEDNG